MNLILRQTKSLVLIVLLLQSLSVLFLSSCKKDESEGGGGTPVITNVRPVDPAMKDVSLTSALPGTNIVIQGDNLTDIVDVTFNDISVSFNSALGTSKAIILTIPLTHPTEATLESASNRVVVKTTHGEASYNFKLTPPPPVIYTMSNEYAKPGTKAVLTGLNLYKIDKIIFPGNVEATTGIVTNKEGTMLEVTVPANATQAGPLQVTNKYGSSTSVLLYNDFSTGVLQNADNVNNFSWGTGSTTDNTLFPGNNGKYHRLTFTNVGANNWNWWEGGRSVNLNQVNLPANITTTDPVENYAVKFEMFVKEPWKTGTMFVRKAGSWDYIVRWQPWKAGDGSSVEFKTDSWVTITLPLTMFKTKTAAGDGYGDPAPNFSKLFGVNSSGQLNKIEFGVLFVNDTPTPVAKFDAAIDNMRIVKIK